MSGASYATPASECDRGEVQPNGSAVRGDGRRSLATRGWRGPGWERSCDEALFDVPETSIVGVRRALRMQSPASDAVARDAPYRSVDSADAPRRPPTGARRP